VSRAGWGVGMGMVTAMVVALVPFGALAAGKGKAQVELTGTANLNTATAAQLELLPGVGEKTAKQIIEHRQKTPFTKVEEIVKVKGFGKKKFDRMKPYLAVSGETTLKAQKKRASQEVQGRSAPALE
jgi:competence protein ComEA